MPSFKRSPFSRQTSILQVNTYWTFFSGNSPSLRSERDILRGVSSKHAIRPFDPLIIPPISPSSCEKCPESSAKKTKTYSQEIRVLAKNIACQEVSDKCAAWTCFFLIAVNLRLNLPDFSITELTLFLRLCASPLRPAIDTSTASLAAIAVFFRAHHVCRGSSTCHYGQYMTLLSANLARCSWSKTSPRPDLQTEKVHTSPFASVQSISPQKSRLGYSWHQVLL